MLKPASTAAAPTTTPEKITPPNDDEATPSNHLSPPSNEEQWKESNRRNVDKEERLEFVDDHPQLGTGRNSGAIVGMGGSDFKEESGQGRFDGNDATGEIVGMETECMEEVDRDKVERYEVEKVSNEVEEHQDFRYQVLVGWLNENATKNDLRRVFEEVGEVTNVRLSWDTRSSNRIAFVTFSAIKEASRAIGEIPYPVINGRRYWTAQIKDSYKSLRINKICKKWKKKDLEAKLAEYGVQNYEVLTLDVCSYNMKRNQGYAYVNFPSSQNASQALKLLQEQSVSFGLHDAAYVELADKHAVRIHEIMSHVKRAYLGGLPPEWAKKDVKKQLEEKYGSIAYIVKTKGYYSQQEYCFVTFETREDAMACVHGVIDAGLDYKGEKVIVLARLARPQVKIYSEDISEGSSSAAQEIGPRGHSSNSAQVPSTCPPSAMSRPTATYKEIFQRDLPAGKTGEAGTIPRVGVNGRGDNRMTSSNGSDRTSSVSADMSSYFVGNSSAPAKVSDPWGPFSYNLADYMSDILRQTFVSNNKLPTVAHRGSENSREDLLFRFSNSSEHPPSASGVIIGRGDNQRRSSSTSREDPSSASDDVHAGSHQSDNHPSDVNDGSSSCRKSSQ